MKIFTLHEVAYKAAMPSILAQMATQMLSQVQLHAKPSVFRLEKA
jgi:hypothetical protein